MPWWVWIGVAFGLTWTIAFALVDCWYEQERARINKEFGDD